MDVYTEQMLLSPGAWGGMRDACAAELLARNSVVARVAADRLYQRLQNNKDLNAGWSNWLVRLHTAIPGLVTKDNQQRLLQAANKAGGSWTAPMTAAIHYRLGDLEEAQPLLTTSNGKPQFQALAAMLLYDQGKVAEARDVLNSTTTWFERERDKDPDSAIPAQQGWQDWSARTAVWREAARKLIGPRIAELDDLLAKEPDKMPELLQRARLLTDAGLPEDALDDLTKADEQHPDSTERSGLRGRVLTALNRVEEALPYLNTAVEADSQDAGVYAARAAILLQQQGQTEQAQADLRKSLELEPTEAAVTSLADLLLTEADNATSWTVLKPTEMKSEGGATLTLQEDGSILASGVNPINDVYTIEAPVKSGSLQALRLQVMPDPSLPSYGPGRGGGTIALTGVVASLLTQEKTIPMPFGEGTSDISAASQAIDGNNQTFWGIWPEVAKPHRVVFQWREPITVPENARIAIRLEALHKQYHTHNLGRFRLSVSGDAKAIEHEKNRLTVQRNPNVWLRLAAACRLTGKDLELEKLISRRPETVVAVGNEFFKNKDWEQALRYYNRAITPESKDANLLARRARANGNLKRWDEASADWQRALQLRPNDVALINECAAYFEGLGRNERATDLYTRLIDRRRDNAASPGQLAQAFRLRGAHYVRTAQWKSAAADYAKSVTVDPDSDSIVWMTPAALWAYAADAEQHRLYCRRMAARFGESTLNTDIERTVKVSLLLGSEPFVDQETTAKFLDVAAETKNEGLLKWFLSTKALLACRNGEYSAAKQSVQQSLQLQQAGGGSPGAAPELVARAVQALIFAREGDTEQAQVKLDELKSLQATKANLKWREDGTLDGSTILSGERINHDLLIPEILRREATRLINQNAGPQR